VEVTWIPIRTKSDRVPFNILYIATAYGGPAKKCHITVIPHLCTNGIKTKLRSYTSKWIWGCQPKHPEVDPTVAVTPPSPKWPLIIVFSNTKPGLFLLSKLLYRMHLKFYSLYENLAVSFSLLPVQRNESLRPATYCCLRLEKG